MKNSLLRTLACCFALTVVAAALAAPSIEIRLSNGSAWRGELNDVVLVRFVQQGVEIEVTGRVVAATKYYIKVEGDGAGTTSNKTIFNGDIRSMRTIDRTSETVAASPRKGEGGSVASAEEAADSSTMPGLFLVPLEGGVGDMIRKEEIREIGEHADTFGPGQIIILKITTGGGSAPETDLIADEIFELKTRHRVIAWIEEAISAGCSIAMCCDEIYFMTEGTAGSVTTWNMGTGQSIKGEELKRSMEAFAKIAKRSGRSEYIAYAMKTNSAMCSYDVDPNTGEVTFYGDLSGEFMLSDDKSNLCFNSSNALHSGFSDGTADTKDELAKLLDRPKWRDASTYGVDMMKKWRSTVEKAQQEIPRLMARRGYWKSSGDAEERIGALIQIDLALLRWIDRAPNATGGLSKEAIEREVKELRKQLADMKRAQRRR